MFNLFSILDDALDSIAWMIVFNFASNGIGSQRGTDEHSVSGNESGPRVGQISGNGLSSIPENQRIYGIDPNRVHDWHLIMYVTGLVIFYLASARLAVLPHPPPPQSPPGGPKSLPYAHILMKSLPYAAFSHQNYRK